MSALPDEPVFQVPAARGSDAWQEGKQYIELPASELNADELDELSSADRDEALAWLEAARDHEHTFAQSGA
jgi:hypothetical protein